MKQHWPKQSSLPKGTLTSQITTTWPASELFLYVAAETMTDHADVASKGVISVLRDRDSAVSDHNNMGSKCVVFMCCDKTVLCCITTTWPASALFLRIVIKQCCIRTQQHGWHIFFYVLQLSRCSIRPQ